MTTIDVQILDHPVQAQPVEPFPESAGAECSFLGRTRLEVHPEHGRLVRLSYQAYIPLARHTLSDLAEQASRQFECDMVRIHHAVGEVPIGAVLVDGIGGAPLAQDHNRVEALRDPTAHAEMLVISAAARRLGLKRLAQADLYVTLEPCAMCAAAISLARLRRLYYGAYDPKGGGVDHGARIFEQATTHHRPEVIGGLDEARCAALLEEFFAALR